MSRSQRGHVFPGSPTSRFAALDSASFGGRFYDLDLDKVLASMEKGSRICKLALHRRWDPGYRRMCLNRETRQLLMWKTDNLTAKNLSKPSAVDIRTVAEVMTLDYKINALKLSDKWKRDKEIQQFDPSKILIIAFGSNFVFSYWICLFDTPDACIMWVHGLRHLATEIQRVPHPLIVERWLRKAFYEIVNPSTQCVALKHMKPFIQTRLQYKASNKDLQDLEEQLPFEAFALCYRNLIHLHKLFSNRFSQYSDDGKMVDFDSFLRFLREQQKDKLGQMKDRTSEFLRRYLKDVDAARDTAEPFLTVQEFIDFLFSRENSIWDPGNEVVTDDMDRPLCDYWIASSHNTYLTGDQLKSDSSLDAYAKALLMGCRCIELDCWDPRRENDTDIIIWHGFTLTSKLNLRDVLITIREYAFVTSEYPVILSIEDNCTVPSQRVLASQLKEYLGEFLLTTPISREETTLPSPSQLKRKIILKHKKLPTDLDVSVAGSVTSTLSNSSFEDSFQDLDISNNPDLVRKGVLSLRDLRAEEWTSHLFVLLPDRLCYTLEGQYDGTDTSVETDGDAHDNISQIGDDEISGFGVRPEEMHVTEEWFHGKIAREEAVSRLKNHSELGDGLFLVRDSTVFIGDFSLSFLYRGDVHHCRIRTRMVDGEKRYYFVESKQMDTLYELISYYTRHSLSTPKFRTLLIVPCPQPLPHLDQEWFNGDIGKAKAEELLNAYREDGAFLIRYSSSDKNVFVLSWRVDGDIFHMRLKRDGRIFVVNATVFETLNQIVEYYRNKELYRGACLKFPVNQQAVDQLSASDTTYTPEGMYLALNTLEKETLVRAQTAFNGRPDCNELSFPANALITVLEKDENRRMWRGRYQNETGWFPRDFVADLSRTSEEAKEYEHRELAGAIVERIENLDRPFVFRISQTGSHWVDNDLIVCADNGEDMMHWMNAIMEVKDNATRQVSSLRSKEKNMRIASELSNLVVYCQAVPFNPDKIPGKFYEMCSVSETKHDKLLERGLLRFNRHQISRIYPMATRLKSNNFYPVPMWNSGCQMVALNYQTPDKPMQLNQGRFLANGGCGYLLKPSFMRSDAYDVDSCSGVPGAVPLTLTINVIAARHLYRKDRTRGIVSPVVEVEVVGLNCDNQSYRTSPATSDGLHPSWDEQAEFDIKCPEVALLRFYVEDGDFVKADPFIGQAVFPVTGIRTGYRSVPLRNAYSEELELSALLVLVDLRQQNVDEQKWMQNEMDKSRLFLNNNNSCSAPRLDNLVLNDIHPVKTPTSAASTPDEPVTPACVNGQPVNTKTESKKKVGSKSSGSGSSLKKLFRLGSSGSTKK